MSEEKLYGVLSRVLGVPVGSISDDTSPDTVEKWDSLSHINLIIALEFEFGIHLTPEEAMEMQSVKLIRLTLAEHANDAKRA